MRQYFKCAVPLFLAAAMVINCAGCGSQTKEDKPESVATAEVNDGNVKASGKGNGQSDNPLIVASDTLSMAFNPFTAVSEADQQAVAFTQLLLVGNDRSGRPIYSGIDGETRSYGEDSYTYYGACDLKIRYNKKRDTTTYRITLRDDLVFSDGESVTADDVIFTLYAFCDNSYAGDVTLKDMPIRGLKAYRTKKKVSSISGIKKINDYELTIKTDGYSREMSAALSIPICALHYYGDTAQYAIEDDSFGFTRGDISALCENNTPMGAGPYRYVKYEDGVVYYTSNELYYLGCPKTAYLQLKEMTETLKSAQETMAQQDAAETEEEASNQIAELTELTEGVVDVISGIFRASDYTVIKNANTNGNAVGTTVSAQTVSDGIYHYIGINASRVRVGKAGSDASKALRTALAVIFSICRGTLTEEAADTVRYLNYPVSSYSWISPQEGDADYAVAYARDVSGQEIFKEVETFTLEEILSDEGASAAKIALAKQMALEYLGQAGYETEQGGVTAAPAGASLSFTIWVVGGEANALYPMVLAAQHIFEEIGITLKIKEIEDEEALETLLAAGGQEIWVGTRQADSVDMQENYSARDNLFGIDDKRVNRFAKKLEGYLESAKRKEAYQKCFQIVMDWAVEVPVCEYCDTVLFSTARISAGTIPQNTTPYYSWTEEVYKVTMKK